MFSLFKHKGSHHPSSESFIYLQLYVFYLKNSNPRTINWIIRYWCFSIISGIPHYSFFSSLIYLLSKGENLNSTNLRILGTTILYEFTFNSILHNRFLKSTSFCDFAVTWSIIVSSYTLFNFYDDHVGEGDDNFIDKVQRRDIVLLGIICFFSIFILMLVEFSI